MDETHPTCQNYTDILNLIEESPFLPAFETKGYLALARELSLNGATIDPTGSARTDLEDRIEAAWLFFESDDHDYRYPRKITKHIANLVEAGGCTPELVGRAIDFFDTNSMYEEPMFRLEANLAIAERMTDDEARHALVAKGLGYLTQLAGQAKDRITDYVNGTSTEHPDNSEVRFDNIISLELRGAVLTRNPRIIDSVITRIRSEYGPSLQLLLGEDTDEMRSWSGYLYALCARASRQIGYQAGFEESFRHISPDDIMANLIIDPEA